MHDAHQALLTMMECVATLRPLHASVTSVFLPALYAYKAYNARLACNEAVAQLIAAKT